VRNIRIIPDMTEEKIGDGRSKIEEVHFYPGAKTLVFFVGGKIRLIADAWGGPRRKEPRHDGEPMAAAPTHPGVFVIDHIEAYHTNTWSWSKIPWGTPIRPSRLIAGKVEYMESVGNWRPLRMKGKLVDTQEIKDYYYVLYRRNHFPATWVFSDFGPAAVRYYKDANKNRRLDGKERLSGEMIHTTPQNEAQSQRWDEDKRRVRLEDSHGCIHIRPAAIRVFREAGAFRQGMTLVVHEYRESFDDTTYARTP